MSQRSQISFRAFKRFFASQLLGHFMRAGAPGELTNLHRHTSVLIGWMRGINEQMVLCRKKHSASFRQNNGLAVSLVPEISCDEISSDALTC